MVFALPLALPTVAHEDEAAESADGAGLGLLDMLGTLGTFGTNTAEVGCICTPECDRDGGAGDATVLTLMAGLEGKLSERKIFGNLTPFIIRLASVQSLDGFQYSRCKPNSRNPGSAGRVSTKVNFDAYSRRYLSRTTM